MNNAQTKQLVKDKYGLIALNTKISANTGGCCGTGTDTIDYTIMSDSYVKLDGYVAEADLGLGCGLPTEFTKIKFGDTVVDLGSGAGNDAFIAAQKTGSTGKVIGVDFTEEMLAKAKTNAEKLGTTNVEFRYGDIENIPIDDGTADVIMSNCVLNLVPDKIRAFSEIYRIMKSGGHFCISDIVLAGELPEKIRKAAEMYAGCVSGAIKKEEYLDTISKTGFINITIAKEKTITIPDKLLEKYLGQDELAKFKNSGAIILSLTIYAEKE